MHLTNSVQRHMSRITLFILGMVVFTTSFAGEARKMTRSEYIALYKDDAIRDMQKTGVPACITMAQALLESNDGNSPLAIEANNHFGIKCAEWTGPSYIQDDDKRDECFRKYNSVLESYDDHSNFLKTRPRYSSLFQLEQTDYKGWAKGLKKAGYATDPTYADRLIKIIEDNQLYLLDQGQTPAEFASTSNTIISLPEPKINAEPKRIFVPSVEVVDPYNSRRVLKVNGVDYIIARKGETFKSIAQEFELGYWQLPKYNEMDDDVPLQEGQIVFLKPKKKEGERSSYTVKNGDTVYYIAQMMGIKTKYLYKYNNLTEGQQLQPGQKIYLKKQS